MTGQWTLIQAYKSTVVKITNYFDIFSPCICNQSVIKLCGYIKCRYYLLYDIK